MEEESHPQRKPGKRTNLRWSVLSGLMLGVLFAVCLYFVLENESLNSLLDRWWLGWWLGVVLAYALLVGLLFFMIGFLRGRATGYSFEGLIIILSASLIQAPTALLLLAVFSWAFSFTYMDRYGVLFALFGIDVESGGLGAAWLLAYTLFFQLLLGNIVARIGGKIGSRSSRR